MRIVALGQQKGGCGKSATAINLSCQAIAAGYKTALIDMDSEQGSTIKWGKRRKQEAPLVEVANAVTLTPLLARLRSEGFDWAFLDLPGRNSPVASAGLVAADLNLIPVRPLDMDLEASAVTVQAAIRAKRRYAYLLSISPPQAERKRARQVSEMLASLGHQVTPAIIVQRLLVPDAVAAGQSANEAEPDSPSAAEFKDLFDWIVREIET